MPEAAISMNILRRFIELASTPEEVEAMPENLNKRETRTPGWLIRGISCGTEKELPALSVLP